LYDPFGFCLTTAGPQAGEVSVLGRSCWYVELAVISPRLPLQGMQSSGTISDAQLVCNPL